MTFSGPIDSLGNVPGNGSTATGWKVSFTNSGDTTSVYVVCIP
jgi:hypothetical protein